MKSIDTRNSEFPTVVVLYGRVLLVLGEEKEYQFSTEAWNFFADGFDTLLGLDQRYKPDQFYLFSSGAPKCMLVSHNQSLGMAIYPGAHTGEWCVSFFETDSSSQRKIEYTTHLRTATGQGSVDKAEGLRNLFVKV